MAINTERLQIKVDIDTDQGLRNLTVLQEKYELLIQKNKEAKGSEKASTAKELQAAKIAIDKEREALGLLGLTTQELRKYQRELNAEKARYNEGTDQYIAAAKNATIVGLRLKELTSTQYAYENELKKTVKTQGIEALNIKQLEDYSKQLYNTIINGSKAGAIQEHALYQEWAKAEEIITRHKDSINQAKIVRQAYENEIQETIKLHGLEGLSLEQLEDHSKQLYDSISKGAKAGAIQEHALYNEWVKANGLIKQSKDSLNQARIAQDAYEKELRQTVETQGKEALSLIHLREYYKLLRKEIEETADFNSEANQKRIKEAQDVEKLVQTKDTQVKGTTSFFNQIKGQLPSAVAGAFGGMFVGFAQQIGEQLFSALSAVADKIKKKSREITEIEVALDTTRAVASRLRKDLNDIKTETPVDELQKLAVAAGDLNVATEEVKDFVSEADKIGVVMKKDFGGSTEEAVTMIAKLKGEFKETKELNFGDSMAKIGSVLKGLNLDGPASTQGITDFLKRAGAIPATLKPSITELAAYAAVFEEANLSSEISASGFSKILTVGANNLTAFAKQMRMSREELANLINSNPNEFVLKFTKSLEGLSGTQTAQTLKKLKLESDETFKVVGVLTDNIDKLNRKQAISNSLFNEGTTVNKIFSKYLNDEAGQIAQVEKAWNRITSSFTTFLIKVASPFIMFLAESTEKSKDLNEQYSEQKKSVEKLNTATEPMIQRYEKLSLKAKILGGQQHLLTGEQRELDGILKTLAGTLPATAIQFGKYGEVIGINTDKAREFIKVQKAMLKAQNADVINQTQKDIDSKNAQLEKLQKNFDDKNLKVVKDKLGNEAYQKVKRTPFENTFMTLEEYKKGKQMINDLKTQIDEGEAALIGFKGDLLEVPPLPPVVPEDGKKGGKGGKGGNDNGDGGTNLSRLKNEKIAEAKFLQESTQKEIELRAQLAFEKDQAIANEENKKVQQAERNAEKRLSEIRTQFKDENGLVIKESELSFRQKRTIASEEKVLQKTLQNEVLDIRDEYTKKRAAQILEQTNQAIVIAQQAHTTELEEQLRLAEKSKDTLRIYNAKKDIIDNTEAGDLAKLKIKFENEKIVLKDNHEAIKILETNYEAEKTAITNKGARDRAKLVEDNSEADKERIRKSNEEKLQLDIQEAQQKHVGVLQAEKALLDAQMQQELSAKNLTEAEKTNITRKYALIRKSIEKGSFEEIVQEAISAFSTAFSLITNIFRSSLQQRETEQSAKYNADVKKVNELEEAGVITKKKADAEKSKLEKKNAREMSIIKRDQAKIDKANNISQAVINGIQAVLKSYAVLGPIGGPIAQGLITALTAASIGQIIAQPLPKVEGSFFDGGALPSVFSNPVDNKGGGLIIGHPDEYMIPAWIRQDPVFADIEPTIEYMRKTGRSYDVGGAIGGTPNPVSPKSVPQPNNSKIEELLTRNIEVQELLIDRLQNIEVVVGYEAAEKILDTANQMKSIKDSAKA